jgi:hypothetical protein
MRKLRDDITLKEIREWAEPRGYRDGALIALVDGKEWSTYPESFYEQPLIGSFGKFSFHSSSIRHWGHLSSVSGGVYTRKEGGFFDNFEPCLPHDVDENGYPK